MLITINRVVFHGEVKAKKAWFVFTVFHGFKLVLCMSVATCFSQLANKDSLCLLSLSLIS